ncbi:MAG TPA: SCO family protein [Sphingobacterium sp.]|nr:SCO family protein [Sphingobacterium sp.]
MAKPKSTLKKISALVVILFVPGFLFITINKTGSNSYLSLPVFGGQYIPSQEEKQASENVDKSEAHKIDEISFDNLEGKPIRLFSNDTSVYALHFFYKNDKHFSRDNLAQAKDLSEKFVRNKKIKVISISVDARDTPEELKAFTTPLSPEKHENWEVVTAPSKDIFEFAKKELFIDVFPSPNDEDVFFIENVFLLIDSQHRIRGIYKGEQKTEFERLVDEVKVLVIEEHRNQENKKS